MRPDDIRQELSRSPFGLIRFRLTDGSMFEVGHPDMVIVGRSTVTFSLPDEDDRARHLVIALIHIISMEVLSK